MIKFQPAFIGSAFLLASFVTFSIAPASGETKTPEEIKAAECKVLWQDILDIDMGTKQMQVVVAKPENANDVGAKEELAKYQQLRIKADAKFAAKECPTPS